MRVDFLFHHIILTALYPWNTNWIISHHQCIGLMQQYNLWARKKRHQCIGIFKWEFFLYIISITVTTYWCAFSDASVKSSQQPLTPAEIAMIKTVLETHSNGLNQDAFYQALRVGGALISVYYNTFVNLKYYYCLLFSLRSLLSLLELWQKYVTCLNTLIFLDLRCNLYFRLRLLKFLGKWRIVHGS